MVAGLPYIAWDRTPKKTIPLLRRPRNRPRRKQQFLPLLRACPLPSNILFLCRLVRPTACTSQYYPVICLERFSICNRSLYITNFYIICKQFLCIIVLDVPFPKNSGSRGVIFKYLRKKINRVDIDLKLELNFDYMYTE
jgi:hypothetical protein